MYPFMVYFNIGLKRFVCIIFTVRQNIYRKTEDMGGKDCRMEHFLSHMPMSYTVRLKNKH